MRWAFLILAVTFGAALLGMMFVRADATRLASALRLVGPVVLGAAGLIFLFLGRAQIAGMAFAGAVWLYMAGRRSANASRPPRQRSTVRTAALEMELDHETGGLEGVVLAGRFEGRVLGQLSREHLIALLADLEGDPESRQLLETYLDGRFPTWREDAHPDGGGREASAPGSGTMTEQEAYQILGLEAGASAADIRKAHRRLMQRVHPDLGGSSFLAARINQAKDLLLSLHG